jgi:xanthine dehydrogenase accessory factor
MGEVAEHLVRLADLLGYASVTSAAGDLPADLGATDDVVLALDDHGQAHALELLAEAAARDCAYVGLVAPHRDAVLTLVALARKQLPEGRFQRVVAPAGVDIGAETPGELAVAVAAELVAKHRGGAAAPRAGWVRRDS